MTTTVRALVAAKGWIDLTSASADFWAEETIGKPVLVMGNSAGIVRSAWVTDEGVMAEIEIDESVREEAFERWVMSGIA